MHNIGDFVVVRCENAGVHAGELVSVEGRRVVLRNARRLWRWNGANTLHEVALGHLDATSRISEPCALVALLDGIEILQTTAEGRRKLSTSQWP